MPLLLNLMDELWARKWSRPGLLLLVQESPSPLRCATLWLKYLRQDRNVMALRMRVTVTHDGTDYCIQTVEWVVLWMVMPYFIVLRLKGPPLREMHYSAPPPRLFFIWHCTEQRQCQQSLKSPHRQFGIGLKTYRDSMRRKFLFLTVLLPSRCCLSAHSLPIAPIIILQNDREVAPWIERGERSLSALQVPVLKAVGAP